MIRACGVFSPQPHLAKVWKGGEFKNSERGCTRVCAVGGSGAFLGNMEGVLKLAIFALFRIFFRKIFSNIANIIKNFPKKSIKKVLKIQKIEHLPCSLKRGVAGGLLLGLAYRASTPKISGAKRAAALCLMSVMSLCFSAHAMKVEEYLAKRRSYHTTIYLSGYFDAIYENIREFGGCYREGIKKTDLTYEDLKPELDLLVKRQMEAGALMGEDEINGVVKGLLLQKLSCAEPDAILPVKQSVKQPSKPVKQSSKSVKQSSGS